MQDIRVSLDQWRAFVTVVEQGGFAQAAEVLNRSQSSVSYAVGRLQEQLGISVLRLRGRKAELTEQGSALLGRARQLLDAARDLEGFAHELEGGWEAEIQLVVDAAFPVELLMAALRRFHPQSRDTRVQLTQVVMSGADDALEEGWADLVIGGHVPSQILGDVLLEIEFVAVAHPEHALHRLGRELDMADLARELHVIISDSGVKHKRDSGWLPAQHRWSVTNIDNAIEAIRSGLGYSWLPRHRIQPLLDRGDLALLPLRQGRVYREHMYLMYGKDRPGPATQALADCFREQCHEHAV